MSNEIVTLQFGNYSNYLGAHFWNIQENQFVYSTDNNIEIPDVNHDILFREGINNQNRITYTPRMILYDLKENINTFRTTDALGNENCDYNWHSDKTQIFKEQKNQTSDFISDLEKSEAEQLEAEIKNKRFKNINYLKQEYKMEQQVRYWPDYLKMKYHDRSYNTINQYQSFESDSDPFEIYHYGSQVSKESGFMDNFEDKLRHYTEECNRLQGFQIMSDSFNGFGGLTNNCLNLITEEYAKRSVFTILPFPYFNNQKNDSKMIRLINTAFTLKGLLQDNKDNMALPISLFNSFLTSQKIQPVELPLVKYQPELNYHTSAILASLIDSVTLPWRQKTQQNHMPDFFSSFDTYTYKIASLQSVYPLKINENKYLFNYLQDNDVCEIASWFTPLAASYLKCSEMTTSELLEGTFSVTCNGVEDARVKNIKDNFVFGDIVPAKTVIQRYFEEMYPKSKTMSFSTKTALCTKLPFPNIIRDSTLKTAGHSKDEKRLSSELMTILQMNKAIKPMLEEMNNSISKCNPNRYTKYFENDMEYDDFIELKNFTQDLVNSFA